MFSIIGIVVVFGAIVGGYLMEKGNLLVLMQPAELLIIGGAALGTVLVGNPPHILKSILGGLMGVFTGSGFTRKRYLDYFQNALRPVQPGAPRRAGGHRNRYRRAVQKQSLYRLPAYHQRPPCQQLHLRHACGPRRRARWNRSISTR